MSARPTPGSTRKLSRRRFLASAARTACGVGTAGLLLGLYAGQAKSRSATAIRPPGALDEDAYLGACVRCGLCVRDCPYDALRLAELGEDVALGTPYFVAREVPCEMCEDIPCVAACPTGALDPGLTNIDDARMGLAVLVSQETCLNYRGIRCDVCYRICPLIDEAITLEPEHDPRSGFVRFIPTVHGDSCTGCGKCERSCVLDEAAIKVLPIALARGNTDRPARPSLPERLATGGARVPGVLDLPGSRVRAVP